MVTDAELKRRKFSSLVSEQLKLSIVLQVCPLADPVAQREQAGWPCFMDDGAVIMADDDDIVSLRTLLREPCLQKRFGKRLVIVMGMLRIPPRELPRQVCRNVAAKSGNPGHPSQSTDQPMVEAAWIDEVAMFKPDSMMVETDRLRAC